MLQGVFIQIVHPITCYLVLHVTTSNDASWFCCMMMNETSHHPNATSPVAAISDCEAATCTVALCKSAALILAHVMLPT